MKNLFLVFQFLFIAGAILLFCPRAEAYIHLTYGSLITQFMLSGFLGLLVSTRQSFISLVVSKIKQLHCFEKKST